VGEYYEITGTEETKYYGGKTAMRKGTVLTYLLADHLGSNSLITSDAGNLLSETRYKPWGEIRYATGTTTTAYNYTGQYSNTADFGWMYYKARWYDPILGRFGQADSIVPGAGDPRSWDRYSYVKNNPVMYNDPSGHDVGRAASPALRDENLPIDRYSAYYTSYSSKISYGNNSPTIKLPSQSSTPSPLTGEKTGQATTQSTNTNQGSPTRKETPTMQDIPRAHAADQPDLIWLPWGVPWGEVGLDAFGIFADGFPVLQPSATYSEIVHDLAHLSDVTQAGYDVGILITENQAEKDYLGIVLDLLSAAPEVGVIPSSIGLVYNLGKGFTWVRPNH
jgi:RHS repeat-associated protein